MKIAFIYDAIYPWIKGGVEKRIYEIGKRLVKRGYDVHWYGVRWWFNENKTQIIEKDGMVLHGVFKPIELYVNGKRSWLEVFFFTCGLSSQLTKDVFNIIDCQASLYFPCFLAKFHSLLFKSILIITWHEFWGDYWYYYLGKKGIFGKVVEKLTTKLSQYNVAVSEKTKRDLKDMLKSVEVIPNGVNFKKIQSLKKSDKESDVIFVGRLIKDKNVDVLIKAISIVKQELPDIKCLIIGDGPERTKLEKLVHDLGLEENVEFLGFVDAHDDVIRYMKASKVFVFPSTREGFGMVALEANACGLPVITVDCDRNATKDLIEYGVNGFLCHLSEKAIAKNIIVALDVRTKISEKCIEYARKFDWDVIVDNYEKFLHRCLT